MLARTVTNLYDLARDRTPQGRIRLAEGVADTFFADERELNPAEVSQLEEFLDSLLAGASPAEIRRIFALRGAKASAMPKSVARKLALDEISIAEPLLRGSPALDDADLLEVIGLNSMPHQLAVAGRAAISEAVADALVTTGNPEVVSTLLKNFGAKISRASIEKCTELARQIQALRLPLIERPEFTPADASKLMWWLPRELRQAVLQRFGVATGTGTNSAANNNQTTKNVVDEMLLRFRQRLPNDQEADYAAAWLAERNAINTDLLVQTMRIRSTPLFNALMARGLKLPTELVQKVAVEKSGQLLAVLCRAMNMEKASFASTFMLAYANAHNNKPMNPALLDQALQAYDRITLSKAQTMVKAWRDNPELLKSRV